MGYVQLAEFLEDVINLSINSNMLLVVNDDNSIVSGLLQL